MEKKDLKMQSIKVATKNKKAYVPFAGNEIVKAVLLQEKTKGKVFVVEEFAEVATLDNATSIDLGYLRTNCLVIEVESDTEIEVITLKNVE